MVVAGLTLLIGAHEFVVSFAPRTYRRPWAVLLGPVAGYLMLVGFALTLRSAIAVSVGKLASRCRAHQRSSERGVGSHRDAEVRQGT